MSASRIFPSTSATALAATVAFTGLFVTSVPAAAHGTADTPVSPADLGTPAIVHRLKQMGYTEVRVLREGDDWVDVELRRDGATYTLRASRKLLGPGSLIDSDAAQSVERARIAVAPPPGASAPTGSLPR